VLACNAQVTLNPCYNVYSHLMFNLNDLESLPCRISNPQLPKKTLNRGFTLYINHVLCFQDVITDLNAEGETLPLNPPKEDWLGHKVAMRLIHIGCIVAKDSHDPPTEYLGPAQLVPYYINPLNTGFLPNNI
jgi:hypothetical protein